VVVETGEGEGPSEDPVSSRPGLAALGTFESSSLWETSLFDVFFEAGHIVSNSPILRMNGGADFPGKESPHKEFPPEVRVDLEEAAASRADYFILALLAYPAEAAGRTAKPERVSLRIYSAVQDGIPGEYRFVYEGTSALEAASGGNTTAGRRSAPPVRAEEEQAKRLIRGLIPHLK
jgi:hypothetical protein